MWYKLYYIYVIHVGHIHQKALVCTLQKHMYTHELGTCMKEYCLLVSKLPEYAGVCKFLVNILYVLLCAWLSQLLLPNKMQHAQWKSVCSTFQYSRLVSFSMVQ